jgi:hypothetical protein
LIFRSVAPVAPEALVGKGPVRGIYVRGFPSLRIGIAELITFCMYAGLLAWAIPYHEPWADEAQAWQIARTLSFRQILPALSFEGHPGLWYLVLRLLSRLHVSYAGMHWIAAAVASAGVAVLLIASPFPRFIKLLLPFTFYLSFQYAIVARGYVMVPLLLFLCAYFWPRRLEKPLAIAWCLGLLANVVLHAAVISGGMAIVYLIDLWLARRSYDLRSNWRKLSAAAALLFLLYGIAIWTAFPAKDASGAGLVVRPNPKRIAWLSSQQSQLPREVPPEPQNKKSLDWFSWKLEARLSGGLTRGLVHPFWLGCFFWTLVAWKLFRARKLHYLIPPFLFVVFCADVYAWFWHSGMMLPCVIAVLWMTWPPQATSFWTLPRYEQAPLLMLLLIALLQISWAQYAFQFDHAHDYSPGAETAAFLYPHVISHARIVEIGDDFLSVDSEPYFDGNLFLNQPFPYYWWSTRNPGKVRYQQLLSTHPEIVVLEWRFLKENASAGEINSIPLASQLLNLGYRNTQKFCGGLVEPGRKILEWDCDLIYQPV